MVQTANPQAPETRPYKVLRAFCIAGERIEAGSVVDMSKTLGTEMMSAGKASRYDAEAEAAAAAQAEAEAAAKPAKKA